MTIQPATDHRDLKTVPIQADFVVVGGGLAGVSTAITAARAGLRVVLVQDRPVLGGNGSSEVRLWTLGATAHMGNNCRYAREGGTIDEILVENMHRNPEGNVYIFDSILLEKVTAEANITLLLNTAAFEVAKSDADTIRSVRAFCSQNSTLYDCSAPLFCDASGDGTLGFLSGAAFRMGAESVDEFGEKFAPDQAYGELLGHSMYFYSRDMGRKVRYCPPGFALKNIEQAIPRYRDFRTSTFGCRLWWIEYGGRLDTVHQTEEIKWQLWKVVYGVWDYIKNSGKFPDAENLSLEWVSTIPGKRESRRFEGDYLLKQQDVIEGTHFDDAVSFGGWAIDLHPADGVFSAYHGCTQWQQKAVYQIPYRSMYSRNIGNLFLAGRIISVSHVAFGSTRVMATCAHGGQAVGMAASLCIRDGLRPRDIAAGKKLQELQMQLTRVGQYIPGYRFTDPEDLVRKGRITSSSRFQLSDLPADGPAQKVDRPFGQMLVVPAGPVPQITFIADVAEATTAVFELRTASRVPGFTFDQTIETCEISLPAGQGHPVKLCFKSTIDQPRYVLIAARANAHISLRQTEQRVTGLLSLTNRFDQKPTGDIGVDAFAFWLPARRPGGQNLAMQIRPPIDHFGPESVANGLARATSQPNAWVAGIDDPAPWLCVEWSEPQTLRTIDLSFDTDFDHPMESALLGHPESDMPFCVRSYRIIADGKILTHTCLENHQTRNRIVLEHPIRVTNLKVEILQTHGAPAAIFDFRCYAGSLRLIDS